MLPGKRLQMAGDGGVLENSLPRHGGQQILGIFRLRASGLRDSGFIAALRSRWHRAEL